MDDYNSIIKEKENLQKELNVLINFINNTKFTDSRILIVKLDNDENLHDHISKFLIDNYTLPQCIKDILQHFIKFDLKDFCNVNYLTDNMIVITFD